MAAWKSEILVIPRERDEWSRHGRVLHKMLLIQDVWNELIRATATSTASVVNVQLYRKICVIPISIHQPGHCRLYLPSAGTPCESRGLSSGGGPSWPGMGVKICPMKAAKEELS